MYFLSDPRHDGAGQYDLTYTRLAEHMKSNYTCVTPHYDDCLFLAPN